MSSWEIVHCEKWAGVRRFAVPGGWLYQVEIDDDVESSDADCRITRSHRKGWHQPVFVPGVTP